MNIVRSRCLRALTAVALMGAAASATPAPAGAGGVGDLRSRAQRVADDVTELEHKLASLRAEKRTLTADIDGANRQIGILELQRHELELSYQRALDEYVDRAVEVYKSPSEGVALELILSARDVNELVALSHLTSSSAQAARDSLTNLEDARAEAEDLQAHIDGRKQRLLEEAARLDEVSADIEIALDDRRNAYRKLSAEIKRLEARARRAAQRAAATSPLSPFGSPNGQIAADIPPGFVSTGVAFEGIASWYGPGFEGQTTANGEIFDPDKFTAASRDLPLGSWLYVQHEAHGVVVYVNDRGPYIEGRVLDLSQAAAEAIGITGLGWIRAEVLVKV